MNKRAVAILCLVNLVVLNLNFHIVNAEEIPVLKLEENFEIPIPAHSNTTLALNETIDLSLFNVSCHSLRFEYFTEGHDNFSVNVITLSLIYCYSEIQLR